MVRFTSEDSREKLFVSSCESTSVFRFVMIDLSIKYCGANLISDKKAEIIVKAVFTCWVEYFGAPINMLSDT